MFKMKRDVPFVVKRFINFLKIFMRNTRGVIGLGIILFFTFLAVAGPYLTPYNQLGEDPSRPNQPLAGSEAAPSWVKTLPVWLGGQPDLSEDVIVIKDPTFSSPQVDWILAVSPNVGSAVNLKHKENGGYPPGKGNGCLVLSFRREAGQPPYGNISIRVYKEFDYPYSGPPASGNVKANLFVNGTTHRELIKVWDVTKSDYVYREEYAYDVNGTFRFFIEKVDGTCITIYPTKDYKSLLLDEKGHFKITNAWDVISPLLKANEIFPTSGRYRFGVELLLFDDYNATGNIEFEVRLDNVELNLMGTCWGLLGTDFFGRDILAQLIYGARISLYVGLLSAGLSIAIGLIVGLAAGYWGKIADEFLMRVSDILIVLPGLPLLIVLFAVLGASIENLIILNGFLGWMGFAKVVRSQVLSLRERAFVEAAKAAGAGGSHIMVRHILPNVLGLVYVSLAISVPGAIVSEAALSWLGFADPRRMSWGRMLSEMQEHNAITKWWWVLPPGLCIAAISVSFIMLGYALDDILNPKLRVRR
jgi:ABC-type dipeptide/oligopeptide/nickel transport system permease subunit